MAWYTAETEKFLNKSHGKPEHWSKRYSPGEKVPVSGIYRCAACKKEVTSNANDSDKFPPQNDHQHPQNSPIKWQLIVRTNTSGE
jgi:hypothetical protein